MKKYFNIQAEFQKKLYDFSKMTHEEKEKITKEFILSAHKELSEVLDCINWKSHRREDKNFSLSNLTEELIDVFKYLINIAVVWDISPERFDEVFDSKTAVVLQRHKQEFFKAEPGEKVCAIDLDDVLNEFQSYFAKIYNEKHGTSFKTEREIKKNINSLEYAEFKNWWRESGIKAHIPVKTGAPEFTRSLRNKNYRIIIISSRPYKQYSRIFPDTMYWLKKNKITYDDLYFEEDKHLKILKHFPNLSFMVEDNDKYARQVAKEGYRVFLLKEKTLEFIGRSEIMIDEKGKEIIEKLDIVPVQKLNDIIQYIK